MIMECLAMMKSRMKIIFSWLVAVALVTTGVGIWQRSQLTAWYCAWKLKTATPDHLAAYVRQFEALGLKGTDALVGLFNSSDETACQNAGQVLLKILQIWAPPDERRDGAVSERARDALPGSSASPVPARLGRPHHRCHVYPEAGAA